MHLLMLLRYLYGITEAVVQRSSVKKLFLKISYNSQKSSCTGVSFNKVEGLRPTTLLKRDSSTRVSSVNFARFFGTPVLYNICDRMLLVLVRIGLVWLAANLSIFYIIDCKSSQYWRTGMQFSTDFTLMNTPTNVLTLITQFKW